MEPREIRSLLAQIEVDNPALQVTALQALFDAGIDIASTLLVKLTKTPHWNVRSIAAEMLGSKKNAADDIVIPLIDLLNDSEPSVRVSSAEALGSLGHKAAYDPLVNLLMSDSNPLVRLTAAESLGKLGNSKTVKTLIHALNDPDDTVKSYVYFALGRLATFDIIPMLREQANAESNKMVQIDLLCARYQIGDNNSLPILLGFLRSSERTEVYKVINRLETILESINIETLKRDWPAIYAKLLVAAKKWEIVAPQTKRISRLAIKRLAGSVVNRNDG